MDVSGVGDGIVLELRSTIRSAIREAGYELPIRCSLEISPRVPRGCCQQVALGAATSVLIASGQVTAPRGAVNTDTMCGLLLPDGSVSPVGGYRSIGSLADLRTLDADRSALMAAKSEVLEKDLDELRGAIRACAEALGIGPLGADPIDLVRLIGESALSSRRGESTPAIKGAPRTGRTPITEQETDDRRKEWKRSNTRPRGTRR